MQEILIQNTVVPKNCTFDLLSMVKIKKSDIMGRKRIYIHNRCCSGFGGHDSAYRFNCYLWSSSNISR